MEPNDDPKLRELLREWQLPGAPPSLDRRVLGESQPWWRNLITGSIRVPVPAVIAAFLVMLALAVSLTGRHPAPVATTVSLKEFQPVENLNVRIIRTTLEARP